ncbi:pro-MCH [Falco biarmicus]|uniref:pro-MCH n=1 Tax=Falco cherrug TaxID=345164 RepID=UPI000FFCB7A4|nr:pro-MCH [Falco cherrug]XP_037246237.1 pro-MCH [Falco rusticolus]XP_056197712.1 pro-MCH [Falco biarmicus]
MCISSYMLILSLCLFSQGFLLSVSKSLQKVDEDMLLTTLGKTLRNGDTTGNRGAIPLLKHYKTEDSSVLDEEDDRNVKFLDTGSRHDFLNHVMSINLSRKQLPYLALKGAMAFPADTEIRNIESIQQRETADEENLPKFPIGRRDFDGKDIFILHKNYFILIKYNAMPIQEFDKDSFRNFMSIVFSARERKYLLSLFN